MNDLIIKLKDTIAESANGGLCVAFSAGVDSAVVLKIASMVTDNVVAVTFHTKLHPAADLALAKDLADQMGVAWQAIEIDEFSDPRIMDNPPERCYYCKHLLFSTLRRFAEEHHLSVILDGTNEDDLHLYRPGLKALRELGVISPLAACRITKTQVRQIAKDLGLSVHNRPSAPCLATRLPYGARLSEQLLARIDQAEIELRARGMLTCRVRVHGDIARIEIPKEDFLSFFSQADEIVERMHQLSFRYITLDLEGFRSGSMDIGLSNK